MRIPENSVISDIEEWKNNYYVTINSYFANKENELSEIELNFFFEENEQYNDSIGYSTYYYDVMSSIYYLDEKYFDIMILDERFIMYDIGFFESYIYNYFNIKRPSYELLFDFSSLEKEYLDFFDPKLIKDVTYDNHIFALPYEIDYNVLYYYNQDENLKKIMENIESLNWDEMISSIKDDLSYPINIPLGNDYSILNLLLEYTNSRYNITKEFDPNYFQLFYNYTSYELFDGFYNMIMKYSDENIYDSLLTFPGDGFYSFINRESSFFYGRVSQRNNFNFVENISFTLPPKYVSSFYENYIIINKKSELDKNLLTKVALELTSKEMQLYRAEHLGSIPTFDFTKEENNDFINQYCQMQPDICTQLSKIHRLYTKDVFKTKYRASFFEIVDLVPSNIRNFLYEYLIDNLIFVFRNCDRLITNDLGVYGILSYIFTGIFICIATVVMYLVHKHRKHPYLKVVSPKFCNLIVIGCIMNIIRIMFILPPYSIVRARIENIFNTICTNLIYIPMFSVAYRIYRIYKSKSFLSQSLSNNKLVLLVFIIIMISIIYHSAISIFCRFYYEIYGDIESSRFPIWGFDNEELLTNIYQAYFYIIFICLIFMIIATGRNSKKFGDICYTFVIFILNINNFVTGSLIVLMSYEYWDLGFFLLILYNGVCCLFCIYMLVGSRLLFILITQDDIDVSKYKSEDLKEFIPLKRTINKYLSLIKKVKNVRSYISSKTSIRSTSNNNNSSSDVSRENLYGKESLSKY
ncbi:hypothetical protein U3516DRAFT_862577 [Neocallimastix sp. 'constans']